MLSLLLKENMSSWILMEERLLIVSTSVKGIVSKIASILVRSHHSFCPNFISRSLWNEDPVWESVGWVLVLLALWSLFEPEIVPGLNLVGHLKALSPALRSKDTRRHHTLRKTFSWTTWCVNTPLCWCHQRQMKGHLISLNIFPHFLSLCIFSLASLLTCPTPCRTKLQEKVVSEGTCKCNQRNWNVLP